MMHHQSVEKSVALVAGALTILSGLLVIGLLAALSWGGRFGSDVALVMGTALGAFAAILKDFLLPVGD